jgi:hypothetical protein
MWSFFEDGTFFSTVVVLHDETKRLIRTRDYRSMRVFKDYFGGDIPQPARTPERDYMFRVIVDADQWSRYLEVQAMTMQATNFKSEVAANLSHSHPMMHSLHRIWGVMFEYQERQDRQTRGRRNKVRA